MEDTNTDDRPSLGKQILGAVVGASVALLLYQGYQVSSGSISAWLTAPQAQIAAKKTGTAALAVDLIDTKKYDHIVARASEIYQQFSPDEPGKPAEKIDHQWVVPDSGVALNPSVIPSSSPATEAATPEAEPISSPLPEEKSSSSSSPAQPIPAKMPQYAEVQRRPVGKKLPKSGIGLTLVTMAAGAFTGRSVVRKKGKKK